MIGNTIVKVLHSNVMPLHYIPPTKEMLPNPKAMKLYMLKDSTDTGVPVVIVVTGPPRAIYTYTEASSQSNPHLTPIRNGHCISLADYSANRLVCKRTERGILNTISPLPCHCLFSLRINHFKHEMPREFDSSLDMREPSTCFLAT